MLLFKVSIVMAVMLWLYQHASTLYKGGEIKKKYESLTVWTVEVTIASTRTRRTQTIRDDIRPRAPAGLLSRNSCVVLTRQSCSRNLIWMNENQNEIMCVNNSL